MKKILTLAMVVKDGQVLLGMKKRGFGEGCWNGFGGKVEAHESIIDAARRELAEEVGLVANGLQPVGILDFTFAEDDRELTVHIFRVDEFVGIPAETEEMRPQWFPIPEIPYDRMWPDDPDWLPLLLEGVQFTGWFHFDRPASSSYVPKILSKEIVPSSDRLLFSAAGS